MANAAVQAQVDPLWRAMSDLRRRRHEAAAEACTELLGANPYDQAAWYVKTRALTMEAWIDDTEVEEEGAAEILMDDNAMAQMPRPGTSLARPQTGAVHGVNQGVRPMSSSGRPLTGFSRPGTQGRPGTGSVQDALQGNRPGTSRPVTSGGRFLRLGTASILSHGDQFIDLDRIDFRKYAGKTHVAKALCDYILYVEANPKKALELSAVATEKEKFQDWWWKARLGKCYYQLGLLREAESQFKSSLKLADNVVTVMELCKVYIRMDQPNTALELLKKELEAPANQGSTMLLLGVARIYEALNDTVNSVNYYKEALQYDSSSVEAIACLASHHFYSDQAEIALRFYRRLIHMGVNNPEIWTNVGLCCFYASQYDMCLQCFERALMQADGESLADIWYNIGQVAIGIGDLMLAYRSFKVAISVDSNHTESYNNLGVLELRKGNVEMARTNFQTAQALSPFMFEAFFNHALLAFKLGNFQESYQLVKQALEKYPEHTDSKDLMKELKQYFTLI